LSLLQSHSPRPIAASQIASRDRCGHEVRVKRTYQGEDLHHSPKDEENGEQHLADGYARVRRTALWLSLKLTSGWSLLLLRREYADRCFAGRRKRLEEV